MQGVCNHKSAFLFQIVHYKSLGLKVLPNNVSKTSLPQTWHKPRTKDINPEPISSLQIQKPVKFAKKKLQSNGDKIEDKRTKERDNSICIEPTVYNPLQDEDYSAKKFIADFKKSFASGPKTQFSYILDADQEDNLVSSSYGMLPKGSVISYHFPLKEVDNFCKLKDTPTFPAIPLYSLSRVYSTVFDRNSIEIFEKNIVTEEEAISIENETREQSVTPLWHEMRCSRITSTKFKRIVSRRDNFAKLALDLVSTKNIQTAAMRRGIACERKWLLLHMNNRGVNLYRAGFCINWGIPYLGTSPHYKVYDPAEDPCFGLLEIKCPDKQTITEVPYLKKKDGKIHLNDCHEYYYQVIGQLGITGLKWCDFMVGAQKTTLLKEFTLMKQLF
ncbi:LOW QUALITY PROTEIN: uncharacterized protein LOC135694967 [Rhopilema esculentum]|uniref:LOW QUALITY PROTEIN: uncharacterized protein LOC135694967 n=1 Tax=Rhopilema esculentum TaxID=499914 RepID=UPI0031D67804